MELMYVHVFLQKTKYGLFEYFCKRPSTVYLKERDTYSKCDDNM